MPILVINRKARYEYNTIESFQSGMVLSGEMVKQIRQKNVTLVGSFVNFHKNILQLINLTVSGQSTNVSLLLKPKELQIIKKYLQQKTITCIPINIKTVGRWIKLEIAIAKGKKLYDKKENLKQKDINRETSRELKEAG
jgi:SsrA-binding protein